MDQPINTGVAGSLDAEINIGDIVVSTDAVEHDMDVSALGDPVGQVPRMDVFAFPADKELVRKAVEANKKGEFRYSYIYRKSCKRRPVYF